VLAKLLASGRVRAISTPKAFVVQTGRYRSGQTGQTVNLLALRLRWFESSPAQISVKMLTTVVPTSQRRGPGGTICVCAQRNQPRRSSFAVVTKKPGSGRIPSSLFAGHHHLRDDRRHIHRRRLHSRGHHHRRAVLVRAGEPHSRSMAGLQQFGH
jgi:hypothetical protein